MSKKLMKVLSLVVIILMTAGLLVACQQDKELTGGQQTQINYGEEEVSGSEDIGDIIEADVAAALKDEPYKFSISLSSISNPFYLDILAGVEDSIREQDDLTMYDANGDILKQCNNIEDSVTMGMDACFVTTVNYDGINDALRNAKEAGMMTFLIDALCSDMELPTGSAVSDNYQAGKLAGDALCSAIQEQGGGTIGIFEAVQAPAVIDRVNGCEYILQSGLYPDVELAVRHNGGGIEEAMRITNDWMSANPDLKGIFGLNDPTAQGAIAALESLNLAGEVLVVGIDGATISKGLIIEGKQLGSSIQFPYRMGEAVVKMCYQFLADMAPETVHQRIQTEWISADNVMDYLTDAEKEEFNDILKEHGYID